MGVKCSLCLEPKTRESFFFSIGGNDIEAASENVQIPEMIKLETEQYEMSGQLTVSYQNRNVKVNKGIDSKNKESFSSNGGRIPKRFASSFGYFPTENIIHANQVEYQNLCFGNEWILGNLVLEELISYKDNKYVWSASNFITKKLCCVKIETQPFNKGQHYDISKIDSLLREVTKLESNSIVQIYYYSISEIRIDGKLNVMIVIIEELAQISLFTVNMILKKRKELWSQSSLLKIMADVYRGLSTARIKNVLHKNLKQKNILVMPDLKRVGLINFGSFRPDNESILTATSLKDSLNNSEFSQVNSGNNVPSRIDIRALVLIICRLIAGDESISDLPHLLSKYPNVKYTHEYVIQILQLLTTPDKYVDAEMILNQIETENQLINSDRILGHKEDFSKININAIKAESYTYMRSYERAISIYDQMLKEIESKELNFFNLNSYLVYVNKITYNYIQMNEIEDAKNTHDKINRYCKKNPTAKEIIKKFEKDYIEFKSLSVMIEKEVTGYDTLKSKCLTVINLIEKKNIPCNSYIDTLKTLSGLYLKHREVLKGLEILKKLLDYLENNDPNSREKIESCILIGDLYFKTNEIQKALKHYQKALELMKKGRADHALHASAELRLAKCYRSLSESNIELFHLLNYLEITKRFEITDMTDYRFVLKRIAFIHYENQNFGTSLQYFLSFLNSYDKYGAESEDRKEAIKMISRNYLDIDETEKAREYVEKLLKILRKAEDDSSLEFIESRDLLAEIDFKEGKYAASANTQKQNFKLKQTIYEEGNINLLIALNNIGHTYYMMGKFDEALEYHKECLNIIGKFPKVLAEYKLRMVLNVALDYEKIGQFGNALQSINKSLELAERNGILAQTEHIIEEYEALSKLGGSKIIKLNFGKLSRVSG